MSSYLIFVLLVFLAFVMWAMLFAFMRSGKSQRTKKVVGVVLIGPLHGYLQSRGYRLTNREILGWLLVLFLMLAAPFLDRILEKFT